MKRQFTIGDDLEALERQRTSEILDSKVLDSKQTQKMRIKQRESEETLGEAQNLFQ